MKLKIVVLAASVILAIIFFLSFKSFTAKNLIQSNKLSPVENSSDLSYIIVTADKNSNVKLFDSNNKILSNSFVQSQIKNTQTNESAGEDIKELEFSQPKTGIYYLVISSPAGIDGSIRIYDRNGKSVSERVEGNGEVKYMLEFNKESIKQSKLSPQQ